MVTNDQSRDHLVLPSGGRWVREVCPLAEGAHASAPMIQLSPAEPGQGDAHTDALPGCISEEQESGSDTTF